MTEFGADEMKLNFPLISAVGVSGWLGGASCRVAEGIYIGHLYN